MAGLRPWAWLRSGLHGASRSSARLGKDPGQAERVGALGFPISAAAISASILGQASPECTLPLIACFGGHSLGRSYGGSKRGLGFEESVELAGDVADQAASDLAVGLALSPSPLGIGAGGRVIAQPGQDDQVQGLVEVAIARAVESNPDPLARGGWDRGGVAQHREGGLGPAAARMGPGTQHDRATIGPTPVGVSSSGCQARTSAVMARVCSAISASRSWMRRARARRLATVAAVSGSVSARCRSRPQVLTRRGVVRSRSRLRRTSGAATTSAWSWRWASLVAWTAERRAASRTESAARWPAALGWASWSRLMASDR